MFNFTATPRPFGRRWVTCLPVKCELQLFCSLSNAPGPPLPLFLPLLLHLSVEDQSSLLTEQTAPALPHDSRKRALLIFAAPWSLWSVVWGHVVTPMPQRPCTWAAAAFYSAPCADSIISPGKGKTVLSLPGCLPCVDFFKDNISGGWANEAGNGFCGWLNAEMMWQLSSVAMSRNYLTRKRDFTWQERFDQESICGPWFWGQWAVKNDTQDI